MPPEDVPIIHEGVALILCRDATVTKEVLLMLNLDAIDVEAIGDRALVLPIADLPVVEAALHERGIFPRIIASEPPSKEAP